MLSCAGGQQQQVGACRQLHPVACTAVQGFCKNPQTSGVGQSIYMCVIAEVPLSTVVSVGGRMVGCAAAGSIR